MAEAERKLPEEKTIHSFSAEIEQCIERVEIPRSIFRDFQKGMEELITWGRRNLPPRDLAGDWGRWIYHQGLGQGVLYAPVSVEGGIMVLSLQVAGDIEDNDISQAGFTGAYAGWTRKHKTGGAERDFQYAAVVVPGPSWFGDTEDSERDRKERKFFFYQEVKGNRLRLEQLGSGQLGWHEVRAVGELRGTVGLGAANSERVPVMLKREDFLRHLNQAMERGAVGPDTLRGILRGVGIRRVVYKRD